MDADNVSLIYCGLRIADGSVNQCFLHGKRELFFSRVKGCIIGHKYKAEKAKDGGYSIKHWPEEDGEAEIDEKTLEEWRVRDAAAKAHRIRVRAVRRAEGLKLWNKTLKEIHDIYKTLTWAEQKALTSRVDYFLTFGKEKK